MRPRVTAFLLGALTAFALCFATPASATDVDGPNDCLRTPVDFGDAPEDLDAYPGIPGHFPTCTRPTLPGTQEIAAGCQPISSPPGPTGFMLHLNGENGYWLGCSASSLPMGIDGDNNGKVSLGSTASVCDGSPVDCMESAFGLTFGQDECTGDNDAGVTPPSLRTCTQSTVQFVTYNCGPTREVFLNILLDMNQDGDWNDAFMCPSGVCANEWAVVNAPIMLPPGCVGATSPAFLVGPYAGNAWLRVSISDQPMNSDYPWAGSASLPGQMTGGETEDYPVTIHEPEPEDPCHTGWEDFGDAPEDLQAYASGLPGHFPTCTFASAAGTQEIQCGTAMSTPPGPTGFVRHVSPPLVPPHFWLGCPNPGPPYGVDGEVDGKVSLFPMPIAVSYCNQAVPIDCSEAAFGLTFGQDECHGDLTDSGVAGPLQFVACSLGVVRFKAYTCTDAEVYLNILVDWNEDGDWNDNLACVSPCPTGCAHEWAVKNAPIALVSGCQSVLSPSFATGPRVGQGWLRITLTQEPVGDDFPWNGSAGVPGEAFRGGETEDYPVKIRERILDPCNSEYEDWGDAPENLAAYPTGIPGHFPTCFLPFAPGTQEIQCDLPLSTPPGLTGYVRHFSAQGDPYKVWLGCGATGVPGGIDGERDGKVNLSPLIGWPSVCNNTVPTDCVELAFGVMPFNQDECTGDLVDAGVTARVQFAACAMAGVWFTTTNCSTTPQPAYLNALVDWNQDGDWNDNIACTSLPAGCAHEWAVKNTPMVLAPGCANYVSTTFLAGPIVGPSWMRITVTHDPVPDDFPWNGSISATGSTFRGGETEDYPVEIVEEPVGVGEQPLPTEVNLVVRPNPSRNGVTFEFALPREGDVSLAVYDIAGRKLREMARGVLPAGAHSLAWDYRTDEGTVAPVGLYLVRLHAGDRLITRTMIRIQ